MKHKPYHYLYNNNRWRRLRAMFLQKHPSCAFCGVPSVVVDHIRPHKGDEALFWDIHNLQALCKRCHDSTKQRKERRNLPPVDIDGRLG